jgi:CheY-like chemotaxis protein
MKHIQDSGRPIEILLIEDNPGDVRLTREALRDAKVLNNLTVLTDGEAAMEYLERTRAADGMNKPDLILLDLNLPKKDGREVLEEIKGDAELRTIPVVVLTTSQAEEDILRSYHLHANCYITKPVDFEQFLRIVRHLENFWLSVVRLPSRAGGGRS